VRGQIRMIDNSSGHYLPSGAKTQAAAESAFQWAGFDLSFRSLRTRGRENPDPPWMAENRA